MPKTIARTAQPGRSGGSTRAAQPARSIAAIKPAVRTLATRPDSGTLRRLQRDAGNPPASKAPTVVPTNELWKRLGRVSKEKASPEQLKRKQELRNQLIERFSDIVKYTAERMRMKLPAEVEVDDLMSAGLFGLMDAIDAYDLGRGVKFETYCAQRVRGAIVDELRSMDWVPRLVRSRTAKVDRVRKQIEMKIGRRPTEPELADRLQVSKEEFTKLSKDSRPVGVVSLNRKFFETDSSRDVREIDVIRDVRQQNPTELVQRDDLRVLLTKGLSRSERLILILYYEEEMTMKEIGATLDLSESRVSQMHTSILQRLKAQMRHRLKEL